MQDKPTESPKELQVMELFIDELCDKLPMDFVKKFIEFGLDNWERLIQLTADDMKSLSMTVDQFAVLVTVANECSQRVDLPLAFSQDRATILLEELRVTPGSSNSHPEDSSREPILRIRNFPEHPPLPITKELLEKGTSVKLKPNQKPSLSKVTLITLEEKHLTSISNLELVPVLQNLYLSNNYIRQITGLHSLQQLRVLKLDHNYLTEIQGLGNLTQLEQLYLNSNFITELKGLEGNSKLSFLNISNQNIEGTFRISPATCEGLAYCLTKLEAASCRINDVAALGRLKVVSEVILKNNLLEDAGQFSEFLSGATELLELDLNDNPIVKTNKFRDYLVIMSRSLAQVNGKKILAKQREYLVKLYSLKHAKQAKQGDKSQKPNSVQETQLTVTRMPESSGPQQYNKGIDLRGNAPYMNSKVNGKK